MLQAISEKQRSGERRKDKGGGEGEGRQSKKLKKRVLGGGAAGRGSAYSQHLIHHEQILEARGGNKLAGSAPWHAPAPPHSLLVTLGPSSVK